MIRVGLMAGVVCLAVLGLWLRPVPAQRFEVPLAATLGTGAVIETVFTYTSPEGTAHAPAIVSQGVTFDVIWFDGIRESHNDVRILRGNPRDATVEEALTRQDLSARMEPPQTVLTLGNPLDSDGELLVTAVSLGGWAASSVVHDTGGLARKLSLSPVLNRSHLVKSPVVAMGDGWRMLPSYFEMGAAYGVAVLIDTDGRVRGQSAMAGGAGAIQPMVLPLDDKTAVALLRRFDRSQSNLLASWTLDAGRTWSRPEPLNVPNPSAPVAAVHLEDGRLLMLFNDHESDADTLTFATSSDGGRTWQRTRVLDGPGEGDLRYPMMTVLSDGRIAVTYSFSSKAGIVAHVMSADWALGQ